MAKKLLCVLLSVLMVVSLLSTGVFAEEESTELRGIYGGYESTWNQETSSYSILCTDDLSESQREATVGTTSIKFYFDGNDGYKTYASNIQYQYAYGSVYLWNFYSNIVETGQYKDGNTLASSGNSVTYSLSITDVDTAYSITAGTGWSYYADEPVWTITSIEFLDSTGNVLLTLTDFSGDDEDETDYTFPIEGVEFATSGWSTTYDSTTGVATFGSWTGCGWWFGSSSTLELSELVITATSDIAWQVVVEYVDGTTSTTVVASDGVATVTPEATAISQIYIQSQAAGDIALTDVSYTLLEESSTDYTFPIEGVEFATSGWSTTYDSTTGVATFGSWTGCGWWFGSSSTLELSELVITATSDIAWQVVVEYVDGTTSTTVVASDGVATVTPEATAISQIYIQSQAAGDIALTDVSYTLLESSSDEDNYVFAFSVQNTSTWDGDWWVTEVTGYAEEGTTVTYTITDVSGIANASSLTTSSSQLLITNSGEDLSNVTVTVTATVNGEAVEYSYTLSSVPGGDNTLVTAINSSLYSALTASDAVITITFTVGSASSSPVVVTRTNDFIYVNEEYHALLVYRNSRRYFITVPHTVDSNGYCTVCHMYIGTDDETSTATVDGVEYEVAYSEDVNLAASGWGTYEFDDNSIIDALATDGALLVITRSEATDVVYDSDAGTYEKLGLVDSWWVGDWLRLGTAGHTDADEADDTIIDCMSDDGTTIIYDGATVYAAWVAADMNNGGTATLITNTSGTYTITNVAVYVPAGTITAEDVTVDEPAEEGDIDDEEDEDDMNVDDGDEDETPVETNPTTGAVLALAPMALAGFAVVSSKRR